MVGVLYGKVSGAGSSFQSFSHSFYQLFLEYIFFIGFHLAPLSALTPGASTTYTPPVGP